jgi:hypothetical protein
MTTPTIHNSRYGMAVPAADERTFQLRSVTSLRWRTFTSAMGRVVDGVRMDGDELLLHSDKPLEGVPGRQRPIGWSDQGADGTVTGGD